MRHLFERRILFFGGKGGVGKTTCSAALAVAASRAGKRVLLVSTDPAHSVSDIFQTPVGGEERSLLPGLHALEIDPDEAARRYVDQAKSRLAGLFSPNVVREAARQIEAAASMPGVSDAALLDRVADLVIAGRDRHDLVIFDTAPTGHSLRLLRMPESMGTWIDALARRRRQASEAARAAVEATGITTGRVEGKPDPVLGVLAERAERLRLIRQVLTRAEDTGFVLVLVPERLPIEETARAAHLLEEARIPVAGVVVNRVLPDEAEGAYFRARKAQERRYLDEIDRRFSAARRVRIPQFESDVQGLDALDRVGRHLLAAG